MSWIAFCERIYRRIAWSSNDNQGLEYLKKLRDSGKKIICIDPAKSSTVQYLDSKAEHIRVVPNTDVALMLGIIHTMLVTNKYDKDFIADYTEGFEKFQKYVEGKVEMDWIEEFYNAAYQNAQKASGNG